MNRNATIILEYLKEIDIKYNVENTENHTEIHFDLENEGGQILTYVIHATHDYKQVKLYAFNLTSKIPSHKKLQMYEKLNEFNANALLVKFLTLNDTVYMSSKILMLNHTDPINVSELDVRFCLLVTYADSAYDDLMKLIYS